MKTIKEFLEFRTLCPFCNEKLQINYTHKKTTLNNNILHYECASYNKVIVGGKLEFLAYLDINIDDGNFNVEFSTSTKSKTIPTRDIIPISFIHTFINYHIPGLKLELFCECTPNGYTYYINEFKINNDKLLLSDNINEEFIIDNYAIYNYYGENRSEIVLDKQKNEIFGINVRPSIFQDQSYIELPYIYQPTNNQQSIKKELDTLFLFV